MLFKTTVVIPENWTLNVNELSAMVFQVDLTDSYGRSIQYTCLNHELEQTIENAKEWLTKHNSKID